MSPQNNSETGIDNEQIPRERNISSKEKEKISKNNKLDK